MQLRRRTAIRAAGALLIGATCCIGPIGAVAFDEKLIWQTVWIGTSYNLYLIGLQENADGTRTGLLKNVYWHGNEEPKTLRSWARIDCNRAGNKQVVISQEEGQDVHETEIDIEAGPRRVTIPIHDMWWAICKGVYQKY